MDAKSLKLLLQSQEVPKSVSSADFEKAAKDAKDLKSLDNEQRLQLYGLYKQSIEGNVTSKRPGIFDMVGQAKWDSWKGYDGVTKEQARIGYYHMVNKLTGNGTCAGSTSDTSSKPVDEEKSEKKVKANLPESMGVSVSSFSISNNDSTWADSQTLFKAIVEEDMGLINQCLGQSQGTRTNSANVNIKDETGMTPLHFAADRGLTDVTEMLLNSGATVNAADFDGQTPLMLAVMCDHKDIVELLVRRGASVDMANSSGETALMMSTDSPDINELLTFAAAAQDAAAGSVTASVTARAATTPSTPTGASASAASTPASTSGSVPVTPVSTSSTNTSFDASAASVDNNGGATTPSGVKAKIRSYEDALSRSSHNGETPIAAGADGASSVSGKSNENEYDGNSQNRREYGLAVKASPSISGVNPMTGGSGSGASGTGGGGPGVGLGGLGSGSAAMRGGAGRGTRDALTPLKTPMTSKPTSKGKSPTTNSKSIENSNASTSTSSSTPGSPEGQRDRSSDSSGVGASGSEEQISYWIALPGQKKSPSKNKDGKDKSDEKEEGGTEKEKGKKGKKSKSKKDDEQKEEEEIVKSPVKPAEDLLPLDPHGLPSHPLAIFQALDKADIDMIKRCLQAPYGEGRIIDRVSAKANTKDTRVGHKQGTPLHKAVELGNIEAAQLLIASGALVNAQDTEGKTPLMIAAVKGNAEMIAFLLERDADVAVEDAQGKTALAQSGVVEATKDVIKRAAVAHAEARVRTAAAPKAGGGAGGSADEDGQVLIVDGKDVKKGLDFHDFYLTVLCGNAPIIETREIPSEFAPAKAQPKKKGDNSNKKGKAGTAGNGNSGNGKGASEKDATKKKNKNAGRLVARDPRELGLLPPHAQTNAAGAGAGDCVGGCSTADASANLQEGGGLNHPPAALVPTNIAGGGPGVFPPISGTGPVGPGPHNAHTGIAEDDDGDIDFVTAANDDGNANASSNADPAVQQQVPVHAQSLPPGTNMIPPPGPSTMNQDAAAAAQSRKKKCIIC